MSKTMFKNLSEDDIKMISENYKRRFDSNLSVEKIAFELGSKLNVSERTIRKWFKNLNLTEKDSETLLNDNDHYKVAKSRVFDKNKKYYLVTWAQNNTPIHKDFFKNLISYSQFLNAALHVIPGRYKNPTSIFKEADGEFWADELIPFLDATRNDIANNITIFGDIKIQPTAVNPMSDLQGLCYSTSCIFGSPKIQLQSIPVLPGNKPRIMLTTGACTLANYTDSKSGKKGEFHHTYGAVIVEVKNDSKVFFRQITAKKNGDFNDLYFNVSNGVVSKNDTIEAIVYGDIHAGEHDENLLEVTKNELLEKLTPNHIILHDVFSGSSINPHESKDPFIQYGKQVHGKDDLLNEINVMFNVLNKFTKYTKSKIVIVRSNHDDFLDRWIKNEDWKKLPTMKNSRLYMQFSDRLLSQYEMNPNNVKGIIPELINEAFPGFITLGLNDSYIVKGFELAIHGNLGVNGAKGSPESFRNLNTKMISAHTHTTFRKDGLLVAGTSTGLRLNYTNGPSSWTQGHVIIDKYGKAQNIIFFDGEFTTFNDL